MGAYFGHGALSIANTVGGSAKIVCVEAKRNNVEVIKEHARRNSLNCIEVWNNAIWREAGMPIEFNLTKRQANAIDGNVISGGSTSKVMTTSLPAIIKAIGQAPNLISLTVNGAEVEAIEGLQSMTKNMLPERIIAPGWYKKDGTFRWKIIQPILKDLEYNVQVTSGGLVFAWRI